MNIDRNLILVKGEDRTKDIRTWQYRDGRIIITFNNGASFPYAYYNVEFLKDPFEVNTEDCCVLRNKQPLSNVERIQNFGSYIRIIYKGGYTETVSSREIQFIKSCLSEPLSKNKFEYFKQIAYAVSLHTEDGNNILGNRYSKIDFVREDSILALYLSGSSSFTNSDSYNKTVVYPFGFNSSQKEAVNNALNNKLSIIEGPPGTGKTQTILNIIANAVMRGESIAVVSSNNSAIANVFEKLQKHDLDFIVAFLGSSINKEAFIENQNPKMRSFEPWILSRDEEYCKIESKLAYMNVELDIMLQYKNDFSRLKQKLEEIRLEQMHFLQYYNETNDKVINFRSVRKMNSSSLLKLWIESEQYANEQKTITNWDKILNFFTFGIYNLDFYRNTLDQIVAVCQKYYYEAAQRELQEKVSELEQKLTTYSFDNKMKDYSELSMRLFKSMVGKKYISTSGKREIYEIDDLWKKSEQFISDYPIILSTTYSLRSSLSSKFVYDYVIVDEASQVDLATGALAFSCAKKAIIVGDLKQLPNVVKDDIKKKTDSIFDNFSLAEAYRFSSNSLLSSIVKMFENVPRVMLKEHYRCHPKIIEFCNKKFYNNQLVILTSPKTDRQPLIVYKTVEGNHARGHVNKRQIDVIKCEVIPAQNLNIYDGSVGIVSPYRDHTEAIQETFKGTEVKAATVDKFQGQEKDTIILCTVDNEISDFTDNPNRLNVAVSRAVNQLILVTDGNISPKDSNISDLIKYIQYNNFEIIQSEIYSIFDFLYKSYSKQREELLKKRIKVSEYDSENLMYSLIQDVLKSEQCLKLDVVLHVPLKLIIRDPYNLNDEETAYAMNILTHVDFLIYDKLSKQPCLVVEVDGYAYHESNTKQAARDKLKDEILRKYRIPIVRFKTNESNEKKRLIETLNKILCI